MELPSISIINFSSLKTPEVQKTIRAVNRQVTQDFQSIWGSAYMLRLHGTGFKPANPQDLEDEPVRGEAVIYLIDEDFLDGALGFHSLNASEIPFGFVFVDTSPNWTVTFSHEVLELIIDPTVNLFVPGPDPRNPTNLVLHTYEVCDAVERSKYQIDGVTVSDFLTPSYFSVGDAPGTRNDFLGVGVESFGVTSGSHLAFYDLSADEYVTVIATSDDGKTLEPMMTGESKKDERPTENNLEDAMTRFQKNSRAKQRSQFRTGLPGVSAITRTGRYAAAAGCMKTHTLPTKIPAGLKG